MRTTSDCVKQDKSGILDCKITVLSETGFLHSTCWKLPHQSSSMAHTQRSKPTHTTALLDRDEQGRQFELTILTLSCQKRLNISEMYLRA
jgi:hypothetical protein